MLRLRLRNDWLARWKCGLDYGALSLGTGNGADKSVWLGRMARIAGCFRCRKIKFGCDNKDD